MNGFRSRLERAQRAFLPVVLAAAAAGCDDATSTRSPYIALLRPLSVTWQGGTARVEAASALRVDWTVAIESVPADAGTEPARYRFRVDDQDMIDFSWDRHANIGVVEFVPGDSCVASVSYPQLDPAAPGARLGFKLP